MANIIFFPKHHCEKQYTISEWRKNVGDIVIGGAVLFSYKTVDEGLFKLASNATGTILKIFYPAGSNVSGGSPVCIVGQKGENVADLVKYAEFLIAQKDKKMQSSHLKSVPSEHISGIDGNSISSEKNKEKSRRNDVIEKTDIDIVNITRRKLSEINNDIAQCKQLNQPVSEKAPLVITFAGRFKTGKSSLINAIIGTNILPTRATTATAVVTRIFNSKKAQAYLSENGKNTPLTIEQAQDLILNYQVKDVNHPAEIIFELPIPWLGKDVEIRDTPGMDDSSQDGVLEDIAMNSLRDTDLCICVYDAGAFPSGKERERTKRICEMLGGNVVYAINCINHLNSLEGLNLVEKSAKALFGTMEYTLPEMGKYWCICSAPDNLYLDGFDVWLKNFVSSQSSALKAKVRSASAKSQLRSKCNEYMDVISGLSGSVVERKDTVNKLHTKSITEQQQRIKESIQEKIDELKEHKYSIENELIDVSSLTEKLSSVYGNTEQMSKYDNDYSKMSCAVTADYFQNTYISLCDKYPKYLKKSDSKIVRKSVNGVQFPGKHTIDVAASGEQKVGWAAAGAAFGTCIFPVIGTAIGAAIGGAFGGAVSASTQDNSVPNTISFVRSSVVSTVRGAFETVVQNIIATYNKERDEECDKCKSGYEDEISTLDKVFSECEDTQKNLKLLSEN